MNILNNSVRFGVVALVASAIAASASASTGTQSAATSTPTSSYWQTALQVETLAGPTGEITGSIVVSKDGRTVSGTLPPGYTKAHPPLDPRDPTLGKIIRDAKDTSQLYETKPGLIPPAAAAIRASSPSPANNSFAAPCTSEISNLNPAYGIFYKGQMAGCPRSKTLEIDTYMNVDGVRHQNGGDNQCHNTTQCSIPNDQLFYEQVPHCTYFTNYAHGRINGGSDMFAWNRRLCPYA